MVLDFKIGSSLAWTDERFLSGLLVALYFVFLVPGAIALWSWTMGIKPVRQPIKHNDYRKTLITLFLPTSGTWPDDYTKILSHSACKKNKVIRVSASSLWRNLSSGKIELMPGCEALFRSNSIQEGFWKAELTFEVRWKLRIYALLLRCYLPGIKEVKMAWYLDT
jgi:hypothetical protein